MALSDNVKDHLLEAQSHLRSALANAARNEKCIINKQISDVLLATEQIMRCEEMSDKIEDVMNKMSKKNGEGGFFGGIF